MPAVHHHSRSEFFTKFRSYLRQRLEQGESAVLFRSAAAVTQDPTVRQAPVVRPPLPPMKPRLVLAADATPEWRQLAEAVKTCEACSLFRSRQHVLMGEGDPRAELVFVGEAPVEEEGHPSRMFGGEAGNLFAKILASIGLQPNQVYLCSVLKCRIPGNRNPRPEELAACRAHWVTQLGLLKPKLIVALGAFAAQTLLESDAPIADLRGRVHQYKGIKVIPTLHPAALLYQPQNKKIVWQDMLAVAVQLGLKPVNSRASVSSVKMKP